MATTKAKKSILAETTSGININGIPAIRSNIDAYVNTLLQNATKVGASSKNIQKAIKGAQTVKSVTDLTNAINGLIRDKLTKNLNNLKNDLETVQNRYKSNDESNTTFSSITKNITSGK